VCLGAVWANCSKHSAGRKLIMSRSKSKRDMINFPACLSNMALPSRQDKATDSTFLFLCLLAHDIPFQEYVRFCMPIDMWCSPLSLFNALLARTRMQARCRASTVWMSSALRDAWFV